MGTHKPTAVPLVRKGKRYMCHSRTQTRTCGTKPCEWLQHMNYTGSQARRSTDKRKHSVNTGISFHIKTWNGYVTGVTFKGDILRGNKNLADSVEMRDQMRYLVSSTYPREPNMEKSFCRRGQSFFRGRLDDACVNYISINFFDSPIRLQSEEGWERDFFYESMSHYLSNLYIWIRA